MDLSTPFRRAAAGLLATIACAFGAHAQDGGYDPSFGDAGRTWFGVTNTDEDQGKRMIQLPGGNLLMAGDCDSVACAAWLTQAGTLAAGSGIAGAGSALFSTFPGAPSDMRQLGDVAALADGRLVATVHKSGGGAYLLLVKANGTGLDPSIGNGAGYFTVVSSGDLVRVTPQQQIIVVGDAGPSIVVARYDATFHLDAGFGTGGSTAIGFTGKDFYPHAMTLQRDGKIVVIGQIGAGPPHALGIIRLTAGGTPDPQFGADSDGRYQSTFSDEQGAIGNAIVEDKKGRLVFAGEGIDTYGNALWLVNRVLGGGGVDASFNGGLPQQFKILSSSTEYEPQACCIAMQSDNKIVVAGTSDREPTHSNKYFSIARFTEAGAFDSTFGIGGQSYGDMSTQAPNALDDRPRAMLIQNGGIIVGGSTYTISAGRFSAAKARIDLLLASDFE
jgi:uncharacterized delta-60 repeat protein